MRIALMILLMFLTLLATISCEHSILKPDRFAPERPNQNPFFITTNLKANDGSFSVGYRNFRIRGDRVTLEWNGANDENFLCYRLYRNSNLIRTINDPALVTVTDSLLQDNRNYLYTIATVLSSGISKTDTLTVKTASLDAPATRYRINQDHSIRISWEDRADIPGDYEVWIDGTLQATIPEVFVPYQIRTYNYTYSEAQQYQSYSIVVKKVNMYESSASSYEILYNNYLMAPPILNGHQTLGELEVQLSWHDQSTSSTGFKIYRRISQSKDFSLLTTIYSPLTESFVDHVNLSYGDFYDYAIKAMDDESDPTVLSDYSNIISIPLIEASTLVYDFDDGVFPLGFQNAGQAPWIITSLGAKNYAMRSGNITGNMSSGVQIPLSLDQVSNVQIAFDYMVSSEEGSDFLKFYLNGNLLQQWSGESGWQHYTYYYTYYSPCELLFMYQKDGNVSDGMDCGIIDNITISYLQNGKRHVAKLGVAK